MADTAVALSGSTAGAGGDTEIDLYADVVENDLETVRYSCFQNFNCLFI